MYIVDVCGTVAFTVVSLLIRVYERHCAGSLPSTVRITEHEQHRSLSYLFAIAINSDVQIITHALIVDNILSQYPKPFSSPLPSPF